MGEEYFALSQRRYVGARLLAEFVAGATKGVALRRLNRIKQPMANAATRPGIANTRKFICRGNAAASNEPPNNGPTMAPVRPTPEAQPRPVERMASG